MAEQTPDSWRAAAAATLVVGAALGYRATAGARARLALLAAAGGALAATVPVALAGRRPPIPPRADVAASPSLVAGGAPTFTIVVAARDEAAVLPRLVEDVAAQDHRTAEGRPLFELILIDDRSTDGGAQAALRAAAAAGIGDVTRLVRRGGGELPDGKGAALTALDPSAYRGDVVVVLDADARIGPALLSTLAHYVANGAAAITCRRRILDADSSWLAGAQADEQTLDGELQRGRWAMGGLSEFRGNGIVVRRALLMEVGGWRAEALTEDLDLSSRVAAARGHGVAWALDAEVWEEPVRDPVALWRQRVRWAEGAVRRLFEHGAAVLRSPHVAPRAKLDFAAYAGQLLVPPVVIGALLGALMRGRTALVVLLLAAYGAVAGALSWDSLRWERSAGGAPLTPRERLGRAIRSAVFGSVWLGAVPAALWRLATREGPIVYDKMPHEGSRNGTGPDARRAGPTGGAGGPSREARAAR
jgi:1,2-diacylglycerol 3-beta-glucosyltransferase